MTENDDVQCPICGSLTERRNVKEILGPSELSPVSGSRWVTNTLPESDMTVLIRCSGDEYPVWPGFHDGEQWCSADGSTLEGPVLGWMELETAAEVLDDK